MSKERTTLDITANSEEEALAQAQLELGALPEMLRVEVLDEPDPEDGRDGRFRVSLLSENDETPKAPASRADIEPLSKQVLEELLRHMQVDASVTAEWGEPSDEEERAVLMLNVDGENVEALIGYRGETISSLQYLARLIVARKLKSPVNLVIDVGGYKARRAEQLESLAQRIAEQVAESGRVMHLEPMPAHERRIIHITLRGHPQVSTNSIGEGNQRRVTIIPR